VSAFFYNKDKTSYTIAESFEIDMPIFMCSYNGINAPFTIELIDTMQISTINVKAIYSIVFNDDNMEYLTIKNITLENIIEKYDTNRFFINCYDTKMANKCNYYDNMFLPLIEKMKFWTENAKKLQEEYEVELLFNFIIKPK
jgi:hypothetical protein